MRCSASMRLCGPRRCSRARALRHLIRWETTGVGSDTTNALYSATNGNQKLRMRYHCRCGGVSTLLGIASCEVAAGVPFKLARQPQAIASPEPVLSRAASLCRATPTYLWVLVHRKDINGWWPQSGGSLSVADGWWRVEVKYGGPEDDGHDFEIAALVVRRPVHEQWLEWVETARATGSYPPVQLPKAGVVLAEAHRTVKRIPDQGI